MTNRCEFGRGNHGLAHVAMGTASGSNPLAVAAQMQIRRPQRERTQRSTERSGRESRAGRLMRRLSWHHRNQEPNRDGAISPVSRWWHAEKAVEANLGGRTMSGCKGYAVAHPVAQPISSLSERAGDASRGVGWAHSTDEIGDSITLIERRGPTCGQGRSGPMEGAIPRKGYEAFSFS